jgi:hypothetical protein
MSQHFPKGRRLLALETNILKYRAFEMLLILFHIEELKAFVLRSIQATDDIAISRKNARIPPDAKKKYEKAWAILVNEGVITQPESDELQSLIEYRNLIAHSIGDFTCDLNTLPGLEDYILCKYDYKALGRLKFYRHKVAEGMRSRFVLSLCLKPVLFEAAEKTYTQELRRLAKKIDRQIASRKHQNQTLAARIATSKNGGNVTDPCDPANKTSSGKLTKCGIAVCYKLFAENLDPLTVAYLMQISYRASVNRQRAWLRLTKQNG